MSDDGSDSTEDENKASDGGLAGLDRYLDALSDHRRRYLLYYLKDEGTTTVSDLAKHVVAVETNRSPSGVTEQEYQSVQVELQHKHLPHLADAGLIGFDPRTGDVRFENPPEIFTILLGICRMIERHI